MKEVQLLHAAYEQIVTACDLGDNSRHEWLNAYREFKETQTMITWIDGDGNILQPPTATAEMKLSAFTDADLVRELERRALLRMEYKPLKVIALRSVEPDTIARDKT